VYVCCQLFNVAVHKYPSSIRYSSSVAFAIQIGLGLVPALVLIAQGVLLTK